MFRGIVHLMSQVGDIYYSSPQSQSAWSQQDLDHAEIGRHVIMT